MPSWPSNCAPSGTAGGYYFLKARTPKGRLIDSVGASISATARDWSDQLARDLSPKAA